MCARVYIWLTAPGETTQVLSSRSAKAAHSVTYFSSLSLADYVCSTNRPSQTRLFRARIDTALRAAYKLVVGLNDLDPAGHDKDLHEVPEFTRDLFGLKITQGGGGFCLLSERMNFLNCLNNILPQILNIFLVMGPVVSNDFWTSLSDWIGANSFDHANKAKRWKKFFSNTDSVIARLFKSEIDRVTRLWLNALHLLGQDPDKETKSPFYNRLGVGKLSFGVGIQKLQKACFDDIERLRFRLITQRAQALPLDDPSRMAFFGRYGDRSARQLPWDMLNLWSPALGGVPSRGAALFRPTAYNFGSARWRQDSQSRQQRAMLGGQVRS
jgi:hypothetical protein